MTPNGEHQKVGVVHSWCRVKILTPRHLCENPTQHIFLFRERSSFLDGEL